MQRNLVSARCQVQITAAMEYCRSVLYFAFPYTPDWCCSYAFDRLQVSLQRLSWVPSYSCSLKAANRKCRTPRAGCPVQRRLFKQPVCRFKVVEKARKIGLSLALRTLRYDTTRNTPTPRLLQQGFFIARFFIHVITRYRCWPGSALAPFRQH